MASKSSSSGHWLPTFPAVALRIIELFADDDAPIVQLADVIKSDPALTARILRVANAPIYCVREKICTLEHAISWLGRSEVAGLAIGNSLAEFSDRDESVREFLKSYWRQSFIQGQAMSRIAEVCTQIHKSQAAIAGILMDFGRLLLLDCYPGGYLKTIEKSQNTRQPLHLVEMQHLKTTHAAIGQTLLENMGLPEQFSQVARLHVLTLDELDAHQDHEYHHLINAAVAASSIGDFFCRTNQADSLALAESVTRRFLGFEKSDLIWLFEAVQSDIEEKADLFSVDLTNLPSISTLLGKANQQSSCSATPAWQSSATQQKLINENQRLRALVRNLEDRACRDSMTGLFNREYLFARLQEKIYQRLFDDFPIALLVVDIDQLKAVNDVHGHLVGDSAIQCIARCLATFFQKDELDDEVVVARYGGDEFVVLLETKELNELQAMADQLCHHVSLQSLEISGLSRSFSVSVGGVWCSIETPTPVLDNQFFDVADHALLASKNSGGNSAHIVPWSASDSSRHPTEGKFQSAATFGESLTPAEDAAIVDNPEPSV